MDFTKPETVLNLQNIRDELVRMEDSIIFKFIERSHFATCPSVYEANHPGLEIRILKDLSWIGLFQILKLRILASEDSNHLMKLPSFLTRFRNHSYRALTTHKFWRLMPQKLITMIK